jgi:hypothetical protein
MSDRITHDDIIRAREAVNVSLRDGIKIRTGRRNGHTELDLYDRKGYVRLLHAGTAREVHTYLRGMRAALDIVNR